MKKLILASAVAVSVATGSVQAAQNGQITFLGAVTATTCDLVAEINGAEKNQIDLGVVKVGGTGTAVDFRLVKDASAGAACTGLTSGKKAFVTFRGNLTDKGVGNQQGTATEAYVLLTPKNGDSANAIKKSSETVAFDATKLNGGGLQFSAQLNPGGVPGDFRSVVSYVVAYN